MSEYNGHPSRAHWNVHLWLYNDERLYRIVQSALRSAPDLESAATALLLILPAATPDGVSFTLETVAAAVAEDYEAIRASAPDSDD